MADCGPPQQHHGGCNGAAALREPTQRFSALQQPLLCAAIHFFHRHIRCDAEVLQRMEGNRMFGLFFEVPYHGKPDLSRIFADSVHDCSALHVCSFILSILHQGMFSVSAFIVSVIYLSRFKESSHITLHAYTWRPLFLTSLLLADKMWEDKPVKNSSLAKLFPVLSNLELNTMEREFLLQIHFNILVKPDLFCSFCEKLLIEKVREDICQCVSESEFVSSLLLQQQQPDADGYDCEEVAAGPMPGPGLASVAGMLAPGLRRPYEQATLVAHQQLVPAARSFDELGQQPPPPAPQQQPPGKPARSLSSAAWLQPQGAVKVHVAVAGTQRTPSGQRSPLRAQQLQAAVQPPPRHQQHPHSENIMENGRVKSVDQHAEKRARSGQRQVAQNVSRLHHPARRSLPAKTTVVASYAPFGAKAAAAANGHTPAKHLGTSDGHLSLDVDFNGGPHRAQKTPRSPLGSQPLDQCLQQQQQQHQQPFLRSHLRQLYQMQQQPWAGQQQQQQQQQHGQHQAPVAWAPTPPAPGPQQHNIAPRGAGMAVRRPMTQQSPGNGAATPLAPGGAVMAAGDFGARPRHSVFPPRSAGPPTRAASAPGVPSAAGGGSSGRHSSPHVSTSSHVRTPSQPTQGCGAAAGPPALGSQPALLRPGSPLHSSGLPGGGGGAPTSSFITPPPQQGAGGPGGPYRQHVPAMMFQGGAATRNNSPMVAAPGHPSSAPRTSSGGLKLGQSHHGGHAGGQPALSTRSLSPVGHAAPGTASSLCLNGLTLQQAAAAAAAAGQRPLAGGPSTARSMSPGHAAPHLAAGPAGPQTARPAQRGASLM